MMTNTLLLYPELLQAIKTRIRTAQIRALLTVNAELLRLYWEIGQIIDQRQQQEGWGSGVIRKLAIDLHNELPELKGFSERNLKRMLAFYRAYSTVNVIVPQPVAQLPNAASRTPNDYRKHATDQPTIGLILCQDKNTVVAEYAQCGVNKPIGISEYELTRALPESLQSALPSIEAIEAELQGNLPPAENTLPEDDQ